MPAPFAALEARVNAAGLAHIANAEATLPDATIVSGLFDAPSLEGGAFGVVAATLPMFTGPSVALSGLEIKDTVTVADTDYEIAAIEPDGTGLTVLKLK